MGLILGVAGIAVAAPAHAADPVQVNCTMAGPGGGNGSTNFRQVPHTDIWEWTIKGIAACSAGPGQSQYEVAFTGTGRSEGLGQCSSSGVVNNLSILMDLTFFRIDTGSLQEVHENWGASTTTFPEATPFLISNGETGQGVLITHIFDHCPPGGTSSTVYQWTQSL